MNSIELIELLENENVDHHFNEIFYDENDDEIENIYDDEFVDHHDVDVDEIFDYCIENYDYEFELIIEINDDVDVEKLKHEIEIVDPEIHVVDENEFELIYRND